VTAGYITGHDIYLGEGDGAWQEPSRYQVWTNRYPLSEAPLSIIERREGNVFRVPEAVRVMHRIPAFTPYHVEHFFGFWRSTGGDTIFIRAEVEGFAYYTLIIGTHGTGFGTETIAWFCPKCGAELRSLTFDLKRYGLPKFLNFALEAVREFNVSATARTCAGCGNVHPISYGMYPQNDDELEKEARAAW
jgi:hypothetical protein